MNIKYERKHLIKALELACKVTTTGRIRPALKYVQITAQEGECAKLEATDLETGLTIFCGSKSDGNGTCLIEPKSTLKWLRQIKDQDVTLTYEGTKAVLVANGISMACDTLPDKDYPDIAAANVKDNELAKIGATEFRQAIDQTAFAMAREQGRYCIGCLYLGKERGRFTMVATDGHRLSVTRTNSDFVGKEDGVDILVPAGMVDLLPHVLSRYENDTFHVRAKGTYVTVESACVIVTGKMDAGIFPKYKQVIPKKAGLWEFRVQVDALLERLKMVAPVAASKECPRADIHLGKEIIISAKGDGDGCEVKALPLVPKTLVRGDEMIASVNPQYVIDFLETLPVKEVTLHMHDKMMCVESGNGVYVLMYVGGESKKVEKPEPVVEKAPEIKEIPKMEDRPIPGKQYHLTSRKGKKCIAKGNTWAESAVEENDECKEPHTSSESPVNVTPPTPTAPTEPVSGTGNVEPAKVAATSSTASSEGQAHIETHIHLKKNFQYHIVVPHSRVSREEWESMTGKARTVGGWYGNKYKDVPGGYCFKDKAVASKFMADHFAGVNNMVEQPKAEPKREPMGPLATCRIDRKPNVMHLSSGAELYGPGVIESDDHGEQVIARLMASGIDWNLPLEKLQENPAIESIVTEALKEKEAPKPEPVAKVAPESNIVKVDFSTPDADLELQEALALAERL